MIVIDQLYLPLCFLVVILRFLYRPCNTPFLMQNSIDLIFDAFAFRSLNLGLRLSLQRRANSLNEQNWLCALYPRIPRPLTRKLLKLNRSSSSSTGTIRHALPSERSDLSNKSLPTQAISPSHAAAKLHIHFPEYHCFVFAGSAKWCTVWIDTVIN